MRHRNGLSAFASERRAGFSLIELLITMVMLSIVGGLVVNTIARQQRFYRGASEIMDVRFQMRSAIDILSAELRGISASGGDIYAGTMTSTDIQFRSNFGTSIACRMLPLSNQVYLPPNSDLAAGNRLSFLGKQPVAGNGIFILDEGASEANSDDIWQLRNITAVANAVNPCTGTTFTGAGDVTKTGLLITFDAALPVTVLDGATVRLVQRVRYGIYQASDAKWYLGYCESADLNTVCATLQPAAGPYQPSAASSASGLSFYYYNESGAITTDRLLVSRIDVAIRGISGNWVSRSGKAATNYFSDTSRVVVGVRNRR